MADVVTSGLEPPDQELITRWKAGDEAAASALVGRHADAVARFAVAQGEREEIEELVQDTFVRAFSSLDGFRGESSFRTWLLAIARNLIRDRSRAIRWRRRHVEIEETHAAVEHDPLGDTVAGEAEDRVLAAMERLSPMQRSVFSLRAGEGMPYREIAEVLGTSEGAARVHYHNAMRAVKEIIDD